MTMNAADRGMSLGLRALNRIAGLELIDRIGMRDRAERIIYNASKSSFRATEAIARRFNGSGPKLDAPARQKPGTRAKLFDLTPSDEQAMMREAIGDFAIEKLRPAALDADVACAAPAELLEQANELGVTMLGVPGELGGAFEDRSATTSFLVAEQLARGDMGLAVALLAPAAVGTALALWGDADQQSTYLAEFAGEKPPSAALAMLERRPLFDPFELETKATKSGDGYVLDGAKSLVPRAADADLFVVAAALDGRPALFVVEATDGSISYEAEPAMGIRAAGTGVVSFDGVKLPAGRLLAGGDPAAYAECVRLARLAWCAVAVGTAQAAADYVVKYVNERVAFGEPISHRQAVAFNVADIAIELEGMRLTALRAASRADQGLDFSREVALARQLVRTNGMQIGSDAVQLLGGHGYTKEHPVERWYRDLRAAGLMEGALLVSVRACCLMISLEVPKKFQGLVDQANQVATEILRPNARKYDLAEHEYPKELDMLAALIDGMNDGTSTGGAGAAGVRSSDSDEAGQSQRHEHGDRPRGDRDVLGRRRPAAVDAAPGARQLGDRLGRRR